MTKRILIDVDDTTGHFREAYRGVIARLHKIEVDPADYHSHWDVELGHKLTPKQIQACWDVVCDTGFFATLEPIPGAIEAITQLAKNYEIAFVSKPAEQSITWLLDRRAWLQHHFGHIGDIHFVATGSKFLVDGDYLIEDNVEWAVTWSDDRTRRNPQRQHRALIYAWPYNEMEAKRAGLPRFDSWWDIAMHIVRADAKEEQ